MSARGGKVIVTLTMPLTGEWLYRMYCDEHARRNCMCDTWDDLDDMERSAWDGVAERLATLAQEPA